MNRPLSQYFRCLLSLARRHMSKKGDIWNQVDTVLQKEPDIIQYSKEDRYPYTIEIVLLVPIGATLHSTALLQTPFSFCLALVPFRFLLFPYIRLDTYALQDLWNKKDCTGKKNVSDTLKNVVLTGQYKQCPCT